MPARDIIPISRVFRSLPVYNRLDVRRPSFPFLQLASRIIRCEVGNAFPPVWWGVIPGNHPPMKLATFARFSSFFW